MEKFDPNDKEYLKVLKKSLDNVDHDRKCATDAIKDCLTYMEKQEDGHYKVGMVLAKYLDQLYKSNEQLIKIALALPREDDDNEDESLEAILTQIEKANQEE